MPTRYGTKQQERKRRLRQARKARQEATKDRIRQSLQLTFDRDEMRELLQDSLDLFAIEVGRRVTVGFLEDEVEQLCGPRYQWRRDRTATRYGRQSGYVCLGGQKIGIDRPRVRSILPGKGETRSP
ncbi:MAG: hypothetical protein HYS13_09050 [Planctomycetia bacterium]|nr:hypothetical protein [Planctomycetia bacterium]